MPASQKLTRLVFNLGKNDYFCPLEGQSFSDMAACVQHLLGHSDYDLWRWSIRKSVLEQYGNEIGPFKREQPSRLKVKSIQPLPTEVIKQMPQER